MGLARFFRDHTDQLTIKYDDKIVLGTADYVAPEQVANSHSVDIRADIYGLGATFYFLLSGHPPFPTGTVSQKLLWHRTKDPTPIRQVRPQVPEGMAAVLLRMMAKDPKARYQTPAQLAAELDAWVPATVTLPVPDEMPQLSPAATEVIVEETAEVTVSPSLEAEAVAHAGAQGGRGDNHAATATATRPAANPFGPSVPSESSSPWGPVPTANGNGQGRRPTHEVAHDTAGAEAQQTPNSDRPVPANPFQSDATDPPPQKRSGLLVVVAAVSVLAVCVLAAIKFLT
jgi:serine/threonine protein kinase